MTRNKRVNLFNQAYTHIKNEIHEVYRELTRGDSNDGRVATDRGISNDGKAYLELDNFEVSFRLLYLYTPNSLSLS